MFKNGNVIFIVALALTIAVGHTAFADANHTQWQNVIGIIQAGDTVGTGTGKVRGGDWAVARYRRARAGRSRKGRSTVSSKRASASRWEFYRDPGQCDDGQGNPRV
jgi:hypothetical protein